MTAGLIQLSNWLLLGGAVLFVVAAFNALRAGRQLSSAAYHVVRQDALNRVRRWTFLAAAALLATGGLAIYLSNLPAPTVTANAAAPTPMLVSVPSRMLPTATATLGPTNTPELTPAPTSTMTPLPTQTPPPSLPGILRTPLPSAVPVSPEARLTFSTLASVVDSTGAPTDPGLVFPNGTRRVRLFFQAVNVNDGAVWSILCFKGETLVDSVVELWKWGQRLQTARAFCGVDGSPGVYSIAAYLGPNKQFEITFELLPATPAP